MLIPFGSPPPPLIEVSLGQYGGADRGINISAYIDKCRAWNVKVE